MDRETIFEKVKTIVSETLDVDEDQITESTSFDDVDADSLARLELVTAFEDEFDIEIPDDELENIKNVSDAVDAIEKA